MPKRGNSADYALTQSQIVKLLAACKDIEDRIIVGVPLFLGFRVSELAHMRADWIDEGNLRVPSSQKCGCGECLKKGGEWRPKTKAGIRTLPITSQIRKDLFAFLGTQPDGLQISRVTIWEKTKEVLLRAGIKHKGLANGVSYPHALRATCATMLANGGMSAAGLSYFMGWSSIKIGDSYIRLATAKDGALKQAREIFG